MTLVERRWVALVHSTSCCTIGEQKAHTMNGHMKSTTIHIHLTNCCPASEGARTSHRQVTRSLTRMLPLTMTNWHSTTTWPTIDRCMFLGPVMSKPSPPGQSKHCELWELMHRPASTTARFRGRATLPQPSLHRNNIGIHLRRASWNTR